MPMTKTERATIENIIRRLKKPNCGCSHMHEQRIADAIRAIGMHPEPVEETGNGMEQVAVVARLYLETWVIPALELMLSDKPGDKNLARDLSR